MKILIVDDDLPRRKNLIAYLQRRDVVSSDDVSEAGNIDEARELLSRIYFDVLLLDVILPKRNRGTPSCKHGLTLLSQLTRSPIYKKPAKVIGFTAHVSDIAKYRVQFDRLCFTIVEAGVSSKGWRGKIAAALSYESRAKLAESVSSMHFRVITVHGIRTFGQWQQRFETIVSKQVAGVPFHSYKYEIGRAHV